jgi:hypothetical protein
MTPKFLFCLNLIFLAIHGGVKDNLFMNFVPVPEKGIRFLLV